MKQKKLTKVEIKNFLKKKLSDDDRWAMRALVLVAQSQTKAEMNLEETTEANGVGFSKTDGAILISILKFFNDKRYISQKQMNVIKRRIPKYWKQILKVTDMTKLETIIRSN